MHLHTPRLLLRDFTDHDWPDVLAYQNHPLYLRYNPWATRTPAEVQRFVQMFIDQQQLQPRFKFQLAVVLKANHTLIGNCGIRKTTPNAPEADMGYELAPDYWGRGLATEAVHCIVRFGFTQLGLHRLSAWCVAENTASARVLEKAGLRLEGRLRDKDHFKGRWWDVLLYAMLESDYHQQPWATPP